MLWNGINIQSVDCAKCKHSAPATAALVSRLGSGASELVARLSRFKCSRCGFKGGAFIKFGRSESAAPRAQDSRSTAKKKFSKGAKSKWTDKPAGNTIWESRESKAARDYYQSSQTEDFVRAQRKRLHDLGLD